MAGYMYLGNKKVCPAILVGSQPEPPEYDFLIKIPDNVTAIDVDEVYQSPVISLYYCEFNAKILLDLNNVEEIINSGGFFNAPFGYFVWGGAKCRIDIKAENLRYAGKFGLSDMYDGGSPNDDPFFYNPVITFPKLEEVGSYCFTSFVYGGLTDLYLPKLKTASINAFDGALEYATGSITLHFASNQESLISSLTGYPNFDSNYPVTILYDQPPTE